MWAQDSLWACVGIFLVSGLMKLEPENLYLNIYIYIWGATAQTLILDLKPHLLTRMRPRRSKCLERPHMGLP